MIRLHEMIVNGGALLVPFLAGLAAWRGLELLAGRARDRWRRRRKRPAGRG